MLSSVVNSLTYCVLSHMFFYIFVTFFSNLYILLWQKTMKFVDFFDEIWLNYDWHFLHSLWSTFWKKVTIYAVFGSQISKNVYILGFFCMILYCFVVRLFYILFRIIYHMFCSFVSSKIMGFHVFRKNIIIMISPSGTASYMTEWWSFAQVCENYI